MNCRDIRVSSALLLALLSTPLRAQGPVFSAISFEDSLSTRTTQSKPFLIDIDGDGDLDAFVGEDDGNISFFRNIAGTGKDPIFVAQGGADPFGLTDRDGESLPFLADVDGDGDLDALVGARDGRLHFFRNSAGPGADPVFTEEGAPTPFGLPDVGIESAPFLVDIDGDNDLDAFIGEEDGNINFFRNSAGPNADPVFVAEGGMAPFGLTPVGTDSAPFLGDIDGDGDIDALVGEELGNLTFYRNSAGPGVDPVFTAEGGATPLGLLDIGIDTGPFLADVDGDGDLDALIGEQSGQVSFFRNLAGPGVDPIFSAEGSGAPFGLPDVGYDSDPFLVDIDGDGDLDAFVGAAEGLIRFFRNTAGPGADPVFVAEGGETPFGLVPFDFESSPFLIDIDGDGDLDAFVGDASGFIAFYRNSAGPGVDPVFTPEGGPAPFGLIPGPGRADPFFADIDGDGDIDALIGEEFGGIALFRNSAGPGVDPVFALEAFPAPLGLFPALGESSPFLADLDNDGDLDAIIGDVIGTPLFFRNTAGPGVDPTFVFEPNFTPFGLPISDFDLAPFFVDIDGDGDLDAFLGNDNGYVSFFRNTAGPGPGDPAFVPESSTVPFGLPDVGLNSAPFLVDIEGDGDLDAFIGEDDGTINFLRNIANGGTDPIFVPEGGFEPFGLVFSSFEITPALADIDGDTDIDALIGEDFGDLIFFRNTAGPGVDPVFVPEGGPTPFGLFNLVSDSSPILSDVEGDDDLDVLSGETGGNYFFFRNSAGPGADPVFAAEGGPNPFGLPTVAGDSRPALADIDGDGDLDAFIGDDDGNVVFLRNSAGPMADPVFAAEGGATPFGLGPTTFESSPTFADFDGDGDLDALIGESPGFVRVFRNVLNQAPSFDMEAGSTVDEDSPAQSLPGFASDIEDRDGGVDQALTFLLSNDNNGLFSQQPAIDPISGELTFTPAPDANGSALVTVRLMDDGGTFGGGIDTSGEQTFTITVSPLDDPPVNVTPAASQAAFQETDFVFSAGNGNGLSVIEVDGDIISTTLSVANGVLEVAGPAVITGNSTASVEIVGTVAAVNATLASVTYRGNPGFSGPDTLTMFTQDVPAGLSDTSMVEIQVAAVETSLQFSKSAVGAPNRVGIGAVFTYRLEVTNMGDVTATDVEVTDSLPFSLTFLSSDCADHSDPIVTWIVGSLPPGDTQSCDFLVRVTSGGPIRNVANVQGGNALPQEASEEIGTPPPIPTLSFWGMFGMAAALLAAAWRRLRR